MKLITGVLIALVIGFSTLMLTAAVQPGVPERVQVLEQKIELLKTVNINMTKRMYIMETRIQSLVQFDEKWSEVVYYFHKHEWEKAEKYFQMQIDANKPNKY